MKVLVTSLLRAGDILMAIPVLQAIKRRHAEAEIHLLMNSQFQHLTPLLQDVDHFQLFDRLSLQEGLAEPDTPILGAYDQLVDFIHQVNGFQYDQVINLTHNRLSGWMCSLINAQEKIGLHFDQDGNAIFNSPWFEYLNNHMEDDDKEVFHFSDVFLFGSGYFESGTGMSLQQTDLGKKEAVSILNGASEYLLLQPFTSDTKKEWSFSNWIAMAREMRIAHPSLKFFVLASPDEEERLHELIRMAKASGVHLLPAICSFDGALSLLQKSQMLITGDTSIKHLAAATETKVIELCLGSSDYRKTGVYKDGAVIIKPRTACHPCGHRDSCRQNSHLCGEDLDPEAVALVACETLKREGENLSVISQEFSNALDIFKTQLLDGGYWMACHVEPRMQRPAVERWLDRSTLKFLLEKEHLKVLGEYGSESFRIRESLAKIYPHHYWRELAGQLAKMEDESFRLDQRISQVMKQLKPSVEGPSKDILDISKTRRLQTYLQSAHVKAQIKLKLIRSLKTQLSEIL